MTTPNNDALAELISDLEYSATQADLLGAEGQQLAADIRRAIANLQAAADGGTTLPVAPVPAFTDISTVTDEQLNRVLDAINSPLTADEGNPDPIGDSNTGDDPADDWEDEFDDIVNAPQQVPVEATPQDIVLHVRRVDGFALTEANARAAIDIVLPSLIEVLGQLDVQTVEVSEDDASIANVTLTADGQDSLAKLGAGRDGFNAAFPLIGVGDVVISSTVGQPADPDLAEEFGLNVDLPEVPDGEHPINGVLTLFEERFGYRPQATAQFAVTYSRPDGSELTVDMVHQILAHPISAGLSRLGDSVLTDVVDDEFASSKTAQFLLAARGEIDLATVAMGATAYCGSFDFGGNIGLVHANASAELALVEQPY